MIELLVWRVIVIASLVLYLAAIAVVAVAALTHRTPG